MRQPTVPSAAYPFPRDGRGRTGTNRSIVARSLVCLIGCIGLMVAAVAQSPAWPIQWQVDRHLDHPLAGRIWQPRAQSWVTPAQLREAVAKARFVVLGETHDNPDHHRIQAQLLQAIVAANRHPSVAFEMLDLNQQPALEQFLRTDPEDAIGLGRAVDWAATDWPVWSNYAPIAQVALAHDLRIVAANLPADEVKAVAVKGYAALEPDRVTELGLDHPLPVQWRETMREVLYKGHCELVPKPALTGMIHAQRTRNAVMAWRMQKTVGPDGAVLIAGAGHARTDYGVPMNLRISSPKATVLSVAMVEVEPGKNDPSDYAPVYSVLRLPFDYVLFTPAAEREDPCERLREQFAVRKTHEDRSGTNSEGE